MGFQGNASITSQGEISRQTNTIAGAAPTYNQTETVIGIIHQINEQAPRLVKAHDQDGFTLACDNWIELNHSAREIAERWGTVRVGFRVRVSLTGIAGGKKASAIIIGEENEDTTEPGQPNEAERGLYAIFCPGIGVG